MSSSSPQNRLREATREAHHRLDTHPLLDGLGKGRVEPDAYRAALAGLLRGLAPLEARLITHRRNAPAELLLLPRGPDLAADLIACGGALPAEPARKGPARALADLDARLQDDTAAWLGAAYVLEGARLGGKTIARALAGHDPRMARAATRFFASPGLDVGQRWRHFCHLLNRDLADEAALARARPAALAGFAVVLAGVDDTGGLLGTGTGPGESS